MRFIKKDRGVPIGITQFYGVQVDEQFTEHDYFAGNFATVNKDILRIQLVDEQLGLCAYCQGQIQASSGGCKIEHIICQSHSKHYSLSYHNLLAVCNQNLHCDSARGKDSKNDIKNQYFMPIWFMESCRTISINQPNKFLDIVQTPNTNQFTGELIPRLGLDLYQKSEVDRIILGLALNHKSLTDRRYSTIHPLEQRNGAGDSWLDMFDFYLNRPETPNIEFILLFLIKQITLTPVG